MGFVHSPATAFGYYVSGFDDMERELPMLVFVDFEPRLIGGPAQ